MLNEINRGYLAQKGGKGIWNHEGTKFFLQDDQDFCGGGRFAGVAGQPPGDQGWLCPLEASFFGPNLP